MTADRWPCFPLPAEKASWCHRNSFAMTCSRRARTTNNSSSLISRNTYVRETISVMTNRDNEPSIQPTAEMIDFFERRTREHIARVAANLMRLASVTKWADELVERARLHDAS